MKTGTLIKELRKAHDMTQEELGNILGVKKAAIQKYEKGEIVNLKLATIQKLCEVFQVEPGRLIYPDAERYDIIYNSKNIAIEVKTIEEIESQYGSETLDMIEYFIKLNEAGKAKAIDMIEDLTEIEKYTKSSR